MEFDRLKAAVFALLYVSDGPLAVKKIKEALGEDAEASDIRDAVTSIVEEFEARDLGVKVVELAGGYQIITRPEYALYVKKLQKIRPPKLSTQALETLAIIAYRQPIIRAEMEATRGVNVDGVIKTLLERRLIKIAGRQDVPGKPIMYSTTNEFLQYFGLKDLASLPSLRELEHELGMSQGEVLNILEPELPGLDGPEMEAMAEEYRARRAAEAAKAAEDAMISEARLAEGLLGGEVPAESEIMEEMDREEGDGF